MLKINWPAFWGKAFVIAPPGVATLILGLWLTDINWRVILGASALVSVAMMVFILLRTRGETAKPSPPAGRSESEHDDEGPESTGPGETVSPLQIQNEVKSVPTPEVEEPIMAKGAKTDSSPTDPPSFLPSSNINPDVSHTEAREIFKEIRKELGLENEGSYGQAYEDGIPVGRDKERTSTTYKFVRPLVSILSLGILGLITWANVSGAMQVPFALNVALFAVPVAVILLAISVKERDKKTRNKVYDSPRDGGTRYLVVRSWRLESETWLKRTWRHTESVYILESSPDVKVRLAKKINFNPGAYSRSTRKSDSDASTRDTYQDQVIRWLRRDPLAPEIPKILLFLAVLLGVPAAVYLFAPLTFSTFQWIIMGLAWILVVTYPLWYVIMYDWMTRYLILTDVRFHHEHEPPFRFLPEKPQVVLLGSLMGAKPRGSFWGGVFGYGYVVGELRGENSIDDWIESGHRAKRYNELVKLLNEEAARNSHRHA